MTIHIAHTDSKYGRIPLCGNAMWDELVTGSREQESDCWECRSIAGLPEEALND